MPLPQAEAGPRRDRTPVEEVAGSNPTKTSEKAGAAPQSEPSTSSIHRPLPQPRTNVPRRAMRWGSIQISFGGSQRCKLERVRQLVVVSARRAGQPQENDVP